MVQPGGSRGALDLAAVVVSDLHLGDPHGLLTDQVEGRPRASAALEALGAAMHTLVSDLAGRSAPSLLVNGDGLELALGPRHVAVDAFDQFLAHLMAAGHRFDGHLAWIPGNHDHTLWPAAREELDRSQVSADRTHPPLGGSPATTALLAGYGSAPQAGPRPVRSTLLSTVMAARHPHLAPGGVHIAYPNLGIVEGDRLLVLHHGHLADRFCTLMTPLARRLSGSDAPDDPASLELDNGAWINFLWSSLGEEGRSGDELRRIYDLMHTEAGRVLLGNQVAMAADRRHGVVPRLKRAAIRAGVVRAVQAAKGVGHARLVEDPRPQDDVRLLDYLAGPVARQLAAELAERELPAPRRFSFAFGHTHQPFCDVMRGHGREVDAVNTGGWVVDTHEPRPRTGAAFAVVGGELDLALVRLVQQSSEPARTSVRVQAPQDGSAFADRVRSSVADHGAAWAEVHQELAMAIARRRNVLRGEERAAQEALVQAGVSPRSFAREVDRAEAWARRMLVRDR
jgi:UDP-2,3-diacylglucosamine pyrophosphatase LpxH